MPDLTVLLRVDPMRPSAGQQRSRRARTAAIASRREGLEFQRAVAAAYDEIAARHPDRFVIVDGERPVEEVHERVMAAVGRARAMT